MTNVPVNPDEVPLEILTKRERDGIRKVLPHRYKSTGTLGGHGNWAKPVIEKLLNTCDELESQLNSCRAELGSWEDQGSRWVKSDLQEEL